MERDSCVQREPESLLAAVCQLLREEHKAKQQRLQKEATQVSETPGGKRPRKRPAVRCRRKAEACGVCSQEKPKLELAQKEAERLRRMLEEKESGCRQMTARTEEQQQRWAQDLQAECRNLRTLVEWRGDKLRSVRLPLR